MKKVLIVEDDFIISHLMESYVKSCDCCEIVGMVDNGNDAIRVIEENKPDLILMDVRIEGDKDGIETSELINERWNIPIIYTSGNSDLQTTNRAKKTNMLAFLAKPVYKEELLQLIK
jgi:response regulator of citrate/malate metabolism